MIKIVVPGIPKPAGSKRVVTNRSTGKAYVIDACDKSRDWKTSVAQVARDTYKSEPFLGPIRLEIEFIYPRPKSHYRSNGILKTNAPHWKSTKPDLTKLVRAVEDALTGIIWIDDAQVVLTIAEKHYPSLTQCPCTLITINQWGAETK